MIIKNITIENNHPIICVPIMEKDMTQVLIKAKEVIACDIPMIEWRIDYLEDLKNIDILLEGLQQLALLCKDVILLTTIRTKQQGGRADLSASELSFMLSSIAACHCVDFIDVEYFSFDNPMQMIDDLKKEGAHVIASYHDFEKTPQKDVLEILMEEMKTGNPDIVKVAVMPQSQKDVLTLLTATDSFAQKKDMPVITMAMGSLGMISRITGKIFGSCITFGALGEQSAPGQLPIDELQLLMHLIHKNYKG